MILIDSECSFEKEKKTWVTKKNVRKDDQNYYSNGSGDNIVGRCVFGVSCAPALCILL